MKRLISRALGALGYLLCEAAFRTDCWGPFALVYRLGCAAYEAEIVLGEQWGFLIPNPKFGVAEDEPQLIEV